MTFPRLLAPPPFLVLAAVAALSLSSCADDNLALIEGTVTLNGAPAVEVEVNLVGEGFDLIELTGLLGGFVFEVPPGMYSVRLTAGLAPDVECSPGFSQEVNVTSEVGALVNFACDTRP